MRRLNVIQADPGAAQWPEKKPRWLRVRAPGGDRYRDLKQMMRSMGLNSVCEEAHCPNIGECWDSGTATFLIMGDQCTRNCPYCAIAHGRPDELDEDEPRRVAEMIEQLQLRHVVITSVDRDDLPDGGARIFGWVIEEIRDRLPDCSIEVLTPDFQGMPDSIARVMAARPEIFNHNMETTRRLHRTARPGGRYDRSLDVLRIARGLDEDVLIKTGIMLGLGENGDAPSGSTCGLPSATCRSIGTHRPRSSLPGRSWARRWDSCTSKAVRSCGAAITRGNRSKS
jgi:lipoic acid synthetase